MAEDSKDKTDFTTSLGLFEFEVMPFGLHNTSTSFQRMINHDIGLLLGMILSFLAGTPHPFTQSPQQFEGSMTYHQHF